MPQISMNPPEPQPRKQAEGFDANIEAVEAWIAGLPLANVSETCRLVFNALAEVNLMALPRQQRFRVLELFRRPAHYLGDALQRQFVGASFPPPAKTHKAAALLHGIQLEMAKGYRCISDELLTLDSLRQDFPLLAAALHRALYYLGQTLLTTYQVYRPAAPGLWRHIHDLYDTAERKGLQASPVKDPYRRHAVETSIEAQYKRILLLALADPYHLSQTDMSQVYDLLEQWAPACRLYPVNPFDEPPHAGIVDLEGDAPPAYLVYSTVRRSATCRLLDTTALLEPLRTLMSSTSTAPPAPETAQRGALSGALWKTLLQHLLTAWGMTAKRGYSRVPGAAEGAELVYGLGAIHQCLNGGAAEPENRSSFGHHPLRSRAETTAANESPPLSCTILNESAGGACLKWRQAEPGKLRVGELVAIRYGRQPAQGWGVAALRWIKSLGEHGVEFGIQLLAPDAIPIAVRLSNGEASEHDYLKSLYLPAMDATGQAANLIVPAFLYHSGDIVSLKMEHREQPLRLTKALESNHIYSRFRFTPLHRA